MFSLFRHQEKKDYFSLVATFGTWLDVMRFFEQQFNFVEAIDKQSLIPSNCEIAFKDEFGDIYVVYRDYNEELPYNGSYYDYGYDEYYDDYHDGREDSYIAQRRQELKKWENIFHDPDLLIKRYFPQPKIEKVTHNNEWYLGALCDSI